MRPIHSSQIFESKTDGGSKIYFDLLCVMRINAHRLTASESRCGQKSSQKNEMRLKINEINNKTNRKWFFNSFCRSSKRIQIFLICFFVRFSFILLHFVSFKNYHFVVSQIISSVRKMRKKQIERSWPKADAIHQKSFLALNRIRMAKKWNAFETSIQFIAFWLTRHVRNRKLFSFLFCFTEQSSSSSPLPQFCVFIYFFHWKLIFDKRGVSVSHFSCLPLTLRRVA